MGFDRRAGSLRCVRLWKVRCKGMYALVVKLDSAVAIGVEVKGNAASGMMN